MVHRVIGEPESNKCPKVGVGCVSSEVPDDCPGAWPCALAREPPEVGYIHSPRGIGEGTKENLVHHPPRGDRKRKIRSKHIVCDII